MIQAVLLVIIYDNYFSIYLNYIIKLNNSYYKKGSSLACIKCADATPYLVKTTNLCVKDCPAKTFSSSSVCLPVKNL